MSGVIVPLHEFLSSWEEADVSEMLSSFCCSRDRDLQNFLRDRAISYEKRDLSRTLLLIDGEHIPGQVSLAMTILEIGEEWPVSKTMMKKMNIINGVAPAFLIGQLCKADDIFDPVGKTLTEFAIARFNSVRTLCGGRVICVDCKKELIKYYESQGFVLISTESEEGLYRMVLLL